MSGVIGLWQSDACRWQTERFYVKLFGFETALGKAKAKVDNWERR